MENAGDGGNPNPPIADVSREGRIGLVGYVKRKLQERKTKKEKESSTDRAARITATATVWIAAFTVAMALVGLGTLYEIVEGGADTHDLAVQAKRQADKMKDMSDAADKIREAAQGMVAQEQRIADNAKNALDASNRNSKAALDATLAEMHSQTRLAARPWLGLDDESPDPIQIGGLHIDEKGKATLPYKIRAKNFSNVPASNVISLAVLAISDDATTFYEREKEVCGDNYIGNPEIGSVLFQGRQRVITDSVAIGKVDARHPVGYPIGVWLAGCIGYRDEFGYLYRTRFGAYMVDASGKNIIWMAPPKGVVDVSGSLKLLGGGIDSGEPPKHH